MSPTIKELIAQTGILTTINLPGINHVKEQQIQNYGDSLIASKGLDIHEAQIFNKDLGNDILISIYYDGEILSQINYSQINTAI